MANILDKYLKKIGVKEVHELTQEEKPTYDDWAKSLSGKRITDRDTATFLLSKENDIITELISTSITDKRDLYLKMQLDLIRQIQTFLRTPELEKKMTEYTLQELLKD